MMRKGSFEVYSSTVKGRIGPDGSAVLVLEKGSDDAPGAPVPGRFVDGKFEGTMGGKTLACHRAVSLARN
jgi:hypothetical protein